MTFVSNKAEINLDRKQFLPTFGNFFENMQEVRIIELFAGVGGFRVGLERADKFFYKTVVISRLQMLPLPKRASYTIAAC